MRKEWIRSEEEKLKRRGQLKHIRRHRLPPEHIKVCTVQIYSMFQTVFELLRRHLYLSLYLHTIHQI